MITSARRDSGLSDPLCYVILCYVMLINATLTPGDQIWSLVVVAAAAATIYLDEV